LRLQVTSHGKSAGHGRQEITNNEGRFVRIRYLFFLIPELSSADA
jgi:hypothetical protein